MTQYTTQTELIGDRELVMARRFNAPRVLVWEAWTREDQFVQWWGPEGFATTVKTMEVRPGGMIHYRMSSPEWGDSWGRMTFLEISEPERLLLLDAFSDEDGNPVDGMPDTEITVTFTEEGHETVLTMRSVFATADDRTRIVEMGFEQGMSSSLNRLEQLLATR